MADFSAPSFSLGLDFDEEEPQLPNIPSPERNQYPIIEKREGFDSDETLVVPEQEEEEEPIPRPILKRLRRGPLQTRPSAAEENINMDDDIEEFSSQEVEHRQPDQSPSLQSHASCSNSKFGHGVLSCQSTNKLKPPKSKITPASIPSSSASFEASTTRNLFPRLTVSPLRKIYLVDTDSDDPSPDKGRVKNNKEFDANKKAGKHAQCAIGIKPGTHQPHKPQGEGLWKDFGPMENIATPALDSFWKDFIPKENIATPALDNFCEEYFTSAKFQKVGHHKESERSLNTSTVLDPDDSVNEFEGGYQQKCLSETLDRNWDFPHPQPPAYKYFYHNDARIRSLIRERLRFFVPIGEVNGKGTQQFGAEKLDYMGQFGPAEDATQVCRTRAKGSEGSSRKRGKRSHTSVKEGSDATGSWVNPRGNASAPKDAAKRRVSAVASESGGHWFTGENGKKVYITKDGKELTGQIAYRQYRKESGAGFRKGRKKAAAKRKRK